MGFFLVHRWWVHMWQSHSTQPQWPGMAGVLLFPFAVISSLIIAVLVATLVNRGILRLFGRGTILKNHRRKIAILKKANLRMPDLLFRLQNNTDDEATRLELFHIVEAFPFDFAAQVYLAALDAVETSGGIPTAKQLALDIGRISYSHARADKKPTIYDEAAIQHDIKCTL